MAYFQMDDGTDTELRVFKVGTAAFGLYARCGVWVARNLTDGFIPAEVAASYGTREWIDKLVASGLWTLEDGGFGMPDYLDKHDNKTAVEVRKRRADAAARQAKMRENRKKRQAQNMSQGESRVTHGVTNGVTHTTQSDPPPKGGEEGGAPLREGVPPPSSAPDPDSLTTDWRQPPEPGQPPVGALDEVRRKLRGNASPRAAPSEPPSITLPAVGQPTPEEYTAAKTILDAIPPEDAEGALADAVCELPHGATGPEIAVRAAAIVRRPPPTGP